MKHFAKLQGQDDQGMIRTNTTVCIGKIAPFINPALRQRILLSAFPKAMRDPFPLSRLSGIVAIANTDHFYTLKDIASKVLPSLCMLTIDPEKDVRDEAFKTISKFIQKLEKVSEKPELALDMEKDVSSCSLDLKNETSWTSWAITGLSAKMTGYKTKSQQASVALNTQPLGPPPNMNATTKTTPTTTPEKTISSPSKTIQKEEKKSILSTANNNNDNKKIKEDSAGSGWNDNFDDNNWKDLDEDDDDMEPLEPLEPVKLNLTSKLSTKPNNNQQQQQNSDWSNWTNSFEDTNSNSDALDDFSNFGFTNTVRPAAAATAVNNKTVKNQIKSDTNTITKPASNYNWNSAVNKEEELFSSLVKDISISNKTKTETNTSPSSSGWNDDEWSDVFNNKSSKSIKLLFISKLKHIFF